MTKGLKYSEPRAGLKSRRALASIGMCLLLIFGGVGLTYAKLKSIDEAILKTGGEDRDRYPEDKINAIVSTYVAHTEPAALAAFTEAPKQTIKLGSEGATYDFGKAAFGAARLTLLRPDGHRRSIKVALGERLAAGAQIWHYRPTLGGRGSQIISFDQAIELPAHARSILIQGPSRVRPSSAELPGGLRSVLPFRYLQISGLDPREYRVERIAVRYPFDEGASSFHSSSEELNKVWDLSVYSIEATSFAGIYVDGNRERKPYEADYYITQLGQYHIDKDPRLARHTLEFLLGNPNAITEWLMFPVLGAYDDFQYTGDLQYLKKIYPLLRDRHLSQIARADGLLAVPDPDQLEVLSKRLNLKTPLVDLVDWPPVERDGYTESRVEAKTYLRQTAKLVVSQIMYFAAESFNFERAARQYYVEARSASNRRYRPAAPGTVVNAFRAITLQRLAYLAKATGHLDDEVRFLNEAQRVRVAIQKKLFDVDAGLYKDSEGSSHHSVHANAFPLAFGLVPEKHKVSVTDFVKSKGMAVSPYAAQFLLEGLYKAGQSAAPFALLTANGPRSWRGMMLRTGSTITTESWSDEIKPNQDWSHAWSTAPANLIPRWIMGIQPLEPGFRRFKIKPQPGPLEAAEIRLPTVKGTISVQFRSHRCKFEIDFYVPQGAQADLELPVSRTKNIRGDHGERIVEGNDFESMGTFAEGRHHAEVAWCGIPKS